VVLDAHAIDSPGLPLHDDHDAATGSMTVFGSEIFDDACLPAAVCNGSGTPGAGRRSVRLESGGNSITWSKVSFTVAPSPAPTT